jgi:hypothetical protein
MQKDTCNVNEFIPGQNEREETTQGTIVTKSAAFASYEINYLTYITATYTRAKRQSGVGMAPLRMPRRENLQPACNSR